MGRSEGEFDGVRMSEMEGTNRQVERKRVDVTEYN